MRHGNEKGKEKVKFRIAFFVIIPLIFFGCGTYFHITKPKEPVNFQKFPENKDEMKEQIDLLRGSKR